MNSITDEKRVKNQTNSLGNEQSNQSLYQITLSRHHDESYARDSWEPPQELKACNVLVLDENDALVMHKLHFPLELTNKDYVRRIVDTLGLVLESEVAYLQERYKIESRTADNIDLKNKTKDIKQNKDNKYDGAQIHNFIKFNWEKFQDDGYKFDSDAYESARKLSRLRNDISHRKAKVDKDMMMDAFKCAATVLGYFRFESTEEGENQIDRLKAQFEEHYAFKTRRLRQLSSTDYQYVHLPPAPPLQMLPVRSPIVQRSVSLPLFQMLTKTAKTTKMVVEVTTVVEVEAMVESMSSAKSKIVVRDVLLL